MTIGRIRQGYIKRTAKEMIKLHGSEFTPDFSENRRNLDKYARIQSKFLKNKIAGYITHLVKQKGV